MRSRSSAAPTCQLTPDRDIAVRNVKQLRLQSAQSLREHRMQARKIVTRHARIVVMLDVVVGVVRHDEQAFEPPHDRGPRDGRPRHRPRPIRGVRAAKVFRHQPESMQDWRPAAQRNNPVQQNLDPNAQSCAQHNDRGVVDVTGDCTAARELDSALMIICEGGKDPQGSDNADSVAPAGPSNPDYRLITFASVSATSSPVKARWPVSISKSTAPNAQMSARLSTALPRACSGAM